MKKSIKVAFVVILIIVCIFTGLMIVRKNNKSVVMQDVATNSANEKVSMPYINPEWTEYMKLSEEEKVKIEVVPQKYIYNYIPVENLYDDYNKLPEKFNLTDNYATQIKNQGNRGLCWAYATTSSIESNLKLREGIDTNFSPFHLSYLVSGKNIPTRINMGYGDGMPFVNEIGFHNSILTGGFALIEGADLETNDANVDDVNYFIKDTVLFPEYQNTEDYKNMMKSYLKNYGAIYIATTSPSRSSLSFYKDDLNLIDVHLVSKNSKNCIPNGARYSGHAMVIVGWDDNYGLDENEDGKPDGAWILQNSWGEKNTHPYISYDSDIGYLRGIKTVEEKDWKNNYTGASFPEIKIEGETIEQQKCIFEDLDYSEEEKSNQLLNVNAVKGSVEVTYFKSEYKEKLRYINFTSASQNSTYKVYVSPNGESNSYQLIKEVKTDMPGLYTIDVNDIELNSNKFSIKIETNNGAVYTQINAFTNDSGTKPESYGYIYQINTEEKANRWFITYHSNSLQDSETIKRYEFKIFDKNDEEIELSMEGCLSAKFNNSIQQEIHIPKEIEVGSEFSVGIYEMNNDIPLFKVKTIYNPKLGLKGQGIQSEPFLIKNLDDFKVIQKVPNAYYKLDTDIDFSNNNTIGDLKIKFYGTLDGNGYKLYNYTSENPLFDNLTNAKICNLSVNNFDVNSPDSFSTEKTGLISRTMTDSCIENISVNGTVKGVRVGLLTGNASKSKINNIFAVGNISGSYCIGGLVGESNNSTIEDCVVIANLDTMSRGTHYMSGLVGNSHTGDKISDIYLNINIGENKKEIVYNLIERIVESNQNIENIKIFNKGADGLSIGNLELIQTENNSILYDNFSDFKKIPLKDLGFDSLAWEYLPNNPYPTLKGKPYYFITELSGTDRIHIAKGETKKVENKVNPENASNKKIIFETSDEKIATVDDNGNVTGVTDGNAIITIKTIDGSYVIKEIFVKVGNVIEPYKINKYDCIEEKKIIDNILPTTIEHYKENVAINEPYKIKVFKGDTEVTDGNLATGMITKIYLDDEIVEEYANAVLGDLDGDGIVRSRDVTTIKQYLIGLRDNMYETPAYYASDFTRDGKVRLNDAERIQQYVVKMFKLNEEEYYGQNN